MIDKLNERLTIEKSKAYTDKAGNHRNTWEDYFSCFTHASTHELQAGGAGGEPVKDTQTYPYRLL